MKVGDHYSQERVLKPLSVSAKVPKSGRRLSTIWLAVYAYGKKEHLVKLRLFTDRQQERTEV